MTKEQFKAIVKKTGFRVEEDKRWYLIAAVTNDDQYYVAKYDTDKTRVCSVFPGPFARRKANSTSELIWYGDAREVLCVMTCEELENYLLNCKKKEKEIIKEFRRKQIEEL